MEFHVVIPARLNATRFPGKVLKDIAGKPMIQHVYETAVDSGAESVVIAADDSQVAEVAEGFGANVFITSPDHQSGTDRVAEAVVAMGLGDDDIVVNLQADEPLMPAEVVKLVAEDLDTHSNVKVSTVCQPIVDPEAIFDPNIVKVTLNQRNVAMCFSRAPIPWDKKTFHDPKAAMKQINLEAYHKHLGIYAYRAGFLQEYTEWEECSIESVEGLEQLRILWHCYRIHVAITQKQNIIGVDCEADLKKVKKIMGA